MWTRQNIRFEALLQCISFFVCVGKLFERTFRQIFLIFLFVTFYLCCASIWQPKKKRNTKCCFCPVFPPRQNKHISTHIYKCNYGYFTPVWKKRQDEHRRTSLGCFLLMKISSATETEHIFRIIIMILFFFFFSLYAHIKFVYRQFGAQFKMKYWLCLQLVHLINDG